MNPLLKYPPEQIKLLAGLALIMVALLLRLHNLEFESLFQDEIRQVELYGESYSEIFRQAARQQQPPLDYWIGKVFLSLGNTDFIARLPAVLFGAAGVWLLFLILCKETRLSIATGMAAVMAVLPYHIYFSQYARPYAIAIFLFLALIYCLQTIVTHSVIRWRHFLALFIISFCFLMSRTLAPLVTLAALLLITAIAISLKFTRYADEIPFSTRLLATVLGVIVLALAIYAPILFAILDVSGRYVKQQTGVLQFISNGLTNFSLRPMWQSYVTQLEPLGWILLPLVISAYAFFTATKSVLMRFLLILLPVAMILNLFIFLSKVNYTFRPTYPIYLSPTILILSAVTLQHILHKFPQLSKPSAKAIATLLIIGITGFTLNSTSQFKSLRKVSDWRALAQFLEPMPPEKNIFVFGSLNPYSNWEPSFLGFPRYFHGTYNWANLAGLPKALPTMHKTQLNPVFIMYYYRDYYLTPNSTYPFHPAMAYPMTLDFTDVERDPALKLTKFTSFFVLTLAQPAQNTLDNIQALAERILTHHPDSYSWIELQLVLAAIKRYKGDETWRYNLQHAIDISPPEFRDKVQSIASRLSENS